MTNPAITMTESEHEDVLQLLSEGYGVEDIEYETGVAADQVRIVIAALRKQGLLRKLLNGDPK